MNRHHRIQPGAVTQRSESIASLIPPDPFLTTDCAARAKFLFAGFRYHEKLGVDMSTKTLMTVEQFAQLHTADTEDYELVEGELIPLSSGTPQHARIRRRVERLMEDYFRRNLIGEALGETDCRVRDDTVRRPDVSIFLGENSSRIDMHTIPVPFAPDIAVEVLSQSESAIEVRRKVRDYLRAGSKEVWLLDHSNGELMIHTDGAIRVLQGADALESPLLPGFSASVAELVG